MADLVDAVAIGVTTGGPGIVFPIVLIPIYAVPRAFLIHSYSLIGLLHKRLGSRSREKHFITAPT
jgi:hypothetical protein